MPDLLIILLYNIVVDHVEKSKQIHFLFCFEKKFNKIIINIYIN